MHATDTLRQKFRLFVVILFPILITQLALFAMSFFDTVMSGKASPVDLAGVAIGSNIWIPISTGLTGILLSLTPIISQLSGAKRDDDIPFAVTQGIYLALVLSLIVILLGGVSLTPFLKVMHLEDEVHHVAFHYLIGISFGIVPLFVYTVLRCFIDALGMTRVSMVITLMSLPINVFFNYVLIFGKLGFPRLGGVGAGYASAITYGFITLIAFLVIARVRPFTAYQILKKWRAPAWSAWKEQLTIGVPIGLAVFFETSIFAAVALLMSEFDTITIAANQAAMNFAALLYMVPLSISLALTIAVGFEVGAERIRSAIAYGYMGIILSVAVATVNAIALFIFSHAIAGLYTNDAAVAALTQQFLIFAVFFMLSDAVEAPIQGALRGYKDVNVTLIIALVSYWAIVLPVGLWLAHGTSLGPFGYWVGLIVGLAAGAIGLFWRLRVVQRGYMTTLSAPTASTAHTPYLP